MGAFWIEVASGLTVVAVAAGGARVWRQARKTGRLARLRGVLAEQRAYVRDGCRWKAVLDCDHDTAIARALICKKVPPTPPQDGKVIRLGRLRSHPFQSRRSFAWQVYASFVPFCAQHGWHPLELRGWIAPEVLRPWQQVWTVDFRNADNQMCVVLQPGWTPIPRAEDDIERKMLRASLPSIDLFP